MSQHRRRALIRLRERSAGRPLPFSLRGSDVEVFKRSPTPLADVGGGIRPILKCAPPWLISASTSPATSERGSPSGWSWHLPQNPRQACLPADRNLREPGAHRTPRT